MDKLSKLNRFVEKYTGKDISENEVQSFLKECSLKDMKELLQSLNSSSRSEDYFHIANAFSLILKNSCTLCLNSELIDIIIWIISDTTLIKTELKDIVSVFFECLTKNKQYSQFSQLYPDYIEYLVSFITQIIQDPEQPEFYGTPILELYKVNHDCHILDYFMNLNYESSTIHRLLILYLSLCQIDISLYEYLNKYDQFQRFDILYTKEDPLLLITVLEYLISLFDKSPSLCVLYIQDNGIMNYINMYIHDQHRYVLSQSISILIYMYKYTYSTSSLEIQTEQYKHISDILLNYIHQDSLVGYEGLLMLINECPQTCIYWVTSSFIDSYILQIYRHSDSMICCIYILKTLLNSSSSNINKEELCSYIQQSPLFDLKRFMSFLSNEAITIHLLAFINTLLKSKLSTYILTQTPFIELLLNSYKSIPFDSSSNKSRMSSIINGNTQEINAAIPHEPLTL
ncbi:hypothetical protein WA158_003079 [Blastocystis sp. Blastoise]